MPEPVPENDASPIALPSVRILDHELLRVIGRGGCGEVWLARNILGGYRAIKIVYERTFRNTRPFEREFNGIKKFEPVSRLHDGLVDVLQVGRDDAAGYFYCVMELADDVRSGQMGPAADQYSPRTLASDLQRTGRLSADLCLQLGISLTETLSFLHSRGLVHRDIKPSNIVFVGGNPKLADIGLVAELADARSYVGTDGFIPPEGPGTVQADIYSLGKVLYEMSTGKDRRDYPELPTQFDETIHEREFAGLNRVILNACRAVPQERYRSVEEMLRDLQAVQRGDRVEWYRRKSRARTVVGAAAILLCAALVCLALVLFKNFPSNPTPPDAAKAIVNSPAAVPPPVGLVAWWPGDDDNATDVMSGHPAIALNGARVSPEGKVGHGFSFDGIDDHVRIADRPGLRFSGPMTIEGWICPATNGNWQTIVTKWDMVTNVDQRSFGLGLYPFGRAYFCVSPKGVDERQSYAALSPRAIPLNQWTHLAGSYDGGYLRLYVNGVLQAETPYTNGIFPGNQDLAIGGCVGGGSAGQVKYAFAGKIDEISLYNRALAEAEILRIYTAGNAGKQPLLPPGYSISPGNVIGWWHAEGDVRDSARQHDGTLMNGAGFAPGKFGQAFRFDGKDDFVKVFPATDFDAGDELTIDFWMKADEDRFLDVCCQGLVSTDFYVVEISPGEAAVAGVNWSVNTGADAYTATSDTNQTAAIVSSGEWHYIAATRDADGLQLYVDGKPWKNKVRMPGRILRMRPDSFLTFGSEDGRVSSPEIVGQRYFKGLLDEVRIFNRALSAEEIASLNSGVPGSISVGSK